MADQKLLHGWKAIAGHLKISIKQAHRWERLHGLPINRPSGSGPVIADETALEAWRQGRFSRATFEGNRLVAFDSSDRPLWSYGFAKPIQPLKPDDLAWRIQRVAFQDEPSAGILVTVRYAAGAARDAICYFSAQGHLRWRLESNPPLVDRGNVPFEDAWVFKHVIVTPGRKGDEVWAAFANHSGWAGGVLHVDSQGKAMLHFANAGYVERLCPVDIEQRRFLIVCGENNAFDRAFAALIGCDDPPCCSAPGGRPRYRYENAPSGKAPKYILFPVTELIAAREKPYGHATQIRRHPGDVVIEVDTGGDGASFLYHFSERLDPKYVFPSGSHEFAHQKLEDAGRIKHPWKDCPELEGPLALKVWEPDHGWRTKSIRWRDNPWKER